MIWFRVLRPEHFQLQWSRPRAVVTSLLKGDDGQSMFLIEAQELTGIEQLGLFVRVAWIF